MPNAVEIAYAAVADVISTTLGGAPVAVPGAILARYFESKKLEAQKILTDELRRGKKTELELRDCDDHINILFSFYYAAMRGRAQENLRLLACLIVHMNDEDKLYAREFDKHQAVLAKLDQDEIRVLAFAARELRVARDKTPGFKSIHVDTGNLAKAAFKDREDYSGGALSKVIRSGYIHVWVSGGGISGGGSLVYQTTPQLVEILEILDESFLI